MKTAFSVARLSAASALLLGSAGAALAQPAPEAASGAGWERVRLDSQFRSEGVAVADVNRDGKPDVLVGDFWYEAPRWEKHAVRESKDLGTGENGWSRAFCVFADDVDGDGWSDQIVVGMPGEEAFWYENPRGQPGMWKEHVASASACNESPQFADLFGDGRKYLVLGVQPEGQIVWLEPGADRAKPWERRAISAPSQGAERMFGTDRYDHGLGVGDINGDGRADVVVRQGWWEQPANARASREPWKFHVATLGEEGADMIVTDVDGDGLSDVLSTSAHRRGVWWNKQIKAEAGAEPTWKRATISNSWTQSHALQWADLDGDGKKEMISGKRYWAHGPKGDEDPGAPAVTMKIAIARGADGQPTFTESAIDDQTGIGTQFQVADTNGDGRLDVVVSNKKGVTILRQK